MSNNTSKQKTSRSSLDIQFTKLATEQIIKDQSTLTSAWSEAERSGIKKSKRIKKALADFWYFDKIYFPPESYRQHYAPPGLIHRRMFDCLDKQGIWLIASTRDLTKSGYLIKFRVWQLLRGDLAFHGIFSENLSKARSIIKSFESILKLNERIKEDFDCKVLRSNEDELSFTSSTNKHTCTILPFSDERSPKGTMAISNRLDALDVDDAEASQKVFTETKAYALLDNVRKAFKSCSQPATCFFLTNTEHPKCMYSVLRSDTDKQMEYRDVHLLHFPAWSFKKTVEVPYKGSPWKERYPAKTEKQMKAMLYIGDDHEWSQAMLEPKARWSNAFPEKHYHEYNPGDLPKDAFGVAYCDQNNAKKGKGDYSCFGSLLYSRTHDKFYFKDIVCKSYDDPVRLLDDFLSLFDGKRVILLGMDGNVSQESTWESHLVHWAIRKQNAGFMVGRPPVSFERYRVDDLTESARMPYLSDKMLFPKGFRETDDGKRFRDQLFSFESKKAGRPDDAPDFLICAYTFGLTRRYFKPQEINSTSFATAVHINSGF